MKNERETLRLKLVEMEPYDVEIVRAYLLQNRKFLEEWEPKREDSYYETEAIRKQIEDQAKQIDERKALIKYLILKENDKLIGSVGITNIVYGSFLSGFLGYKLSEEYINRGFVTEALEKMMEMAFSEYGLHRIEANVMPRNERSKKVLLKCGFEYEGTSRKYLKINGKWEDHDHYVKLNEKVE